jgi:hypothetical protein
MGDIMLASDPRLPPERPGRGHGAFQSTTLPVYIPTAHRLLESYIRSLARGRRGQHVGFYLWMVTYIEEYVDADGLLNENQLEGRCKEFYQGLKAGKRHIIALSDELEPAVSATETPT